MARIKGGLNAKKKHNRVLKLAKGYRGARYKQYRTAKQAVMRALTSSYAGRKEKKRQFRQLWIARINAAARLNGLSYSKFMYGLKLANVDLNRKVLADMAVNDAEGFKDLALKFKMVGEIEKHHEERFRQLLKNIEDEVVFSKDKDTIWICRNCGHIVVGKDAPEVCPVCAHPQSYFERKANNY